MIYRYGEPTEDNIDDNPEIFVGRLPCSSTQDITYWVEKLITYEQNPGNGDLSYLTNAFWIKGHSISVDPSTIIPHCPPNLTHTNWNDFNNYTGAQVVAKMSDHYGLLNWHAHGDVFVFTINTTLNGGQNVLTKDDYQWDTGPNNGLDNMTNNKFYSVVYSICCEIAAFDDWKWGNSLRSMAEGFTCFFDDRGGPELLGNTRYGWQGSSPALQMDFYDLLTLGTQDPESGESYFHLGVSEGVSKQGFYDHYTKLTHNLFGCPETQIWVNTPTQFTSAAVTDGGSYLTVNAGVAGSEINVRSLDNGVSYNLTAHNVSSYSFNTSIRPLIVTITKNQYLPFSAVTGGTLTTNGSLSGKSKVLNTITVANSKILTIEPNTILNFTNNSSLVVNGTLNAIGTATDRITLKSNSGTTHSSWGTLTFSGSGAAGSQLKYVDIKYGTKVEAINTSNITIQYCNIDTTYDGIRFNNATGSILNNTITTNSLGHGVVAENAANITVTDNVITKTSTSRNGVGIYVGGGAFCTSSRNDIDHLDWGICSIWSAITFANSPYYLGINNRIRNCNNGLMVYRNSYAFLGLPDLPNNYIYNSIYSNQYNVNVGTYYPDYPAYCYASHNWWGSPTPSSSLFQVGANSFLNYNPCLTSDPWAGLSKIASTNNKNTNDENSVSLINSENTENVLYGIQLLIQGKYQEAKNYFMNIINENPGNQIAYVHLYNCYCKETSSEIIKFFENLPKQASKDHKLLLSYLHLKNVDYEKALEVNNSLIEADPNSSLAARAKLNNAYIALYNDNKINEAIKIFNDVMNKPELSIPVELQMVYDAITCYSTTYGQEAKNLAYLSLYESTNEPELNKEDSLSQAIDLPTEYSLCSNYPNPFNPTTTIKFDLPNDGFVQLKVFDILGNEVATIVNENRVAGSYEVTFNASTFASGVYIYKIQAGTFINSKKMILLK